MARVFLCLTAILMIGQSVGAAPPNIVLLLSDDQGWTDFGFMGHPHIQTPNLDQLSKESLTFTRGYVPSSLCRPSLMTLITGRYAHQHGVVGNDPPPPAGLESATKAELRNNPRYLEQRREYIKHIDDELTWPRLLNERLGYNSFQTGKWWEGNYERGGFTHGMSSGDPTRGGRHGDQGLEIGRKTMQPIYDFISESRKAGKPFFVWYAPMLPHSPHNPPERLLAKYRDKAPTIHIAKYWAMCEWYDETCGQLLKYLDENGLRENTIVISITDNGWINDPDGDRYTNRSKRSQYDGGLRTPIMIRWPGKVQPKIDSVNLASSIDILPTVLAAVGTQPVPGLPGLNLLDESAVQQRQQLYGEIFEHDIQSMTDPEASLMYRWVLNRDWKLIVPNLNRVPHGVVELYRISTDPHEAENVAQAHPEIVAQLARHLNDWWNPEGIVSPQLPSEK